MRRPKDKLIAGLDLHSNNVMIGVINQDGKRLAHRKLDCDLSQVVQFLQPFKLQLQSMAVESTFNWYWLVDGLRGQGYSIDLANPAKIEQYSGMKHVDHYTLLGVLPDEDGEVVDITELYVAKFGVPPVGKRIFIQTLQQINGWRDRPKTTNARVLAP